MNELVSEFFYDGIRRIIPGLLIIILYWHDEAVTVFKQHKHFSSPAFAACLLLVAWLAGFVVEHLGHIPFALALRSMRKEIVKAVRKWWHGEQPLPIPSEKEAKDYRRYGTLIFAEKTMCRSMSWIFLWALISSLSCGDKLKSPEDLYVIHWHPIHFLFGCIVFGVLWLWLVVIEPQFDFNGRQKVATQNDQPSCET